MPWNEDEDLERLLSMLFTKVETLNERTKRQTLQIQNLEKEIKGLKAQK